MRLSEENHDCELIAAFLKGDEHAFELLYMRYKRPLYGFLSNLIVSDAAEVDEVFELTWLRVLDKLPKYRDDGKFGAWLFRVSRNIFFDRARARRNTAHLPLDAENAPEVAAPTGEPDDSLGWTEVGELVVEALKELPVEQREVFLLRQQGVPFKEIAGIQGCSINTALGRMQYATRNLRNLILEIDGGGVL